MGNYNQGSLCVYCIISFLFSFVAYVIVIGVGWALNVQIYTGNSLILASCIVTTIPVLAVLVYFFTLLQCGNDSKVTAAAAICALVTVIIAGFFEVIGAIMFIVAGVQLKDESSQALSYGVTAGVFGLIAGICCCCSVSCYFGATKTVDGQKTTNRHSYRADQDLITDPDPE